MHHDKVNARLEHSRLRLGNIGTVTGRTPLPALAHFAKSSLEGEIQWPIDIK